MDKKTGEDDHAISNKGFRSIFRGAILLTLVLLLGLIRAALVNSLGL